MTGDLPPDFLRVDMTAQDMQVAQDAQTAQMLQAQQVGYNFAAATMPRLSITIVQVTVCIPTMRFCQIHRHCKRKKVWKVVLCFEYPYRLHTYYIFTGQTCEELRNHKNGPLLSNSSWSLRV